MWKNARNAFYKTRAPRNSCLKGNIYHRKSALAETVKIMYSLGSKSGKHQKCFLKTGAVRKSCSKGNIDRS